MSHSKPALPVCIGALVLASLAGCGSSSSRSTGAKPAAPQGAAAGTSSRPSAALYTGPQLHIPTGQNPAVHNKVVGVVTLTSASEVFPRELAAIRAAAGALGWTVKQANMQGDVSQAGPAVENLLQSGVNGIILQSVEPELLGSKAVADAKAKHVPIIETAAIATSKTSGGVLTGSVNTDVAAGEAVLDKSMLATLPKSSQLALINDKLAAEGRIPEAKLRADLAGKVQIVATHQMNYANLVPDISSTVTAWLQQYPSLKAVWCPYDGPCVGAAQAIQSANKDVRVYSQNGVTSILNLMRQGVKITTEAGPLEYLNWLAMDELNSILAGRPYTADWIVPSVLVDEANVPKNGVIDGTQIYGDFVAAFRKRWGVAH
jgi:ABC-type sugar transport system substrate-binding protein